MAWWGSGSYITWSRPPADSKEEEEKEEDNRSVGSLISTSQSASPCMQSSSNLSKETEEGTTGWSPTPQGSAELPSFMRWVLCVLLPASERKRLAHYLITYFPDSLMRFEAAAPASCRHDGGLAGSLLLQATKSQHWTSHTLYSITLLRRSYCGTFLKNLTSILTFCKFLQYAL